MSSVDPARHGERALRETGVLRSPIDQFRRWYDEAVAAEIPMPDAMTLATSTARGRPSARLVLLRGCDERGFVFFTNYDSRKAGELESNPYAALVFHWPLLERQVRVEGRVERTTEEESDEYFATRPRGSQLGAWASPQSRPLAGREELEQCMEKAVSQFGSDRERVPRPPFWGGFRIVPDLIEFWQGQPNRLHDRLCYQRFQAEWVLKRLAP